MIKFLKKYGVCTLFGCMALVHFIATETTSLTPWKGGGYGMYSEYHPTNNHIWIETVKGRFSVSALVIKPEVKDEFEDRTSKCMAFPSTKNLSKLKKLLGKNGYHPIKIEVWRPDFNLETKEYSKVLVAVYED